MANRKLLNEIIVVVLLLFSTSSMAQDEAATGESKLRQTPEAATSESPAADSIDSHENKPEPTAQIPPQDMIPDGLILPGKGSAYSQYTFVADKFRRTLTIWKFDGNTVQFVVAYPIDMGKKEGDKFLSGDLKTPEGIYFFQERLSGSELNFQEYGQMALTMDYPNYFDKRERKTGHGIWLHAVPDTKTLYRGSRGCLVVRNEVIPKLNKFVTLKKTPILVFNKVNYISRQELQSSRQKITQLIENWRKSWTDQNIEAYIEFYGENFKSLGMNKRRWKRYKQSLNEKYNTISVAVNMPIIYKHNDELVVRFLQDYQSDTLSDFGEKSLYLKRNSTTEDFKIYGEEWQPTEHNLLAQKKEAPKEDQPANSN